MASRLFYVRQYTLEYPSSTAAYPRAPDCTARANVSAVAFATHTAPRRAGLTQGACAVDFWTAHDPLQWPQRLTQMLTAYWQ